MFGKFSSNMGMEFSALKLDLIHICVMYLIVIRSENKHSLINKTNYFPI
jgi:hypothetical protein